MKVKVSTVLLGVDGVEPLKGDKNHLLTLKDIIVNSILSPTNEDDERKKYEKYEIFKRIRDNKDSEDVEFTVEEIVIIKRAIGKFQPPLVLGQCFDLLENKTPNNLKVKK